MDELKRIVKLENKNKKLMEQLTDLQVKLIDQGHRELVFRDFVKGVKDMRKFQKTAYIKSKFEPDKLDYMRKAHDLERNVDARVTEIEDSYERGMDALSEIYENSND